MAVVISRQEAVIKVAKISRFINQFLYWIEMDSALYYPSFGEEITELDKWTEEVYHYLRANPTPIIAREIEKFNSVEPIIEYLNNYQGSKDKRLTLLLSKLVPVLDRLIILARGTIEATRGDYTDLVPALAREDVVLLLQRAIDGGLLDEHYMPLPTTTKAQLKVIAYAVASIANFPFRQRYIYFENQWKGCGHIGTVPLPVQYHTDKHLYAMSLYPEADFKNMCSGHENATFYTPYGEKKKRRLHKDLLEGGYIAYYVEYKDFASIFDSKSFSKPVEWVGKLRDLAVFIKLAFAPRDYRNVWMKTVNCFIIFGGTPNARSLSANYKELKVKGVIEEYNPEITEIAKRFNEPE